jgi:hypothetical protein
MPDNPPPDLTNNGSITDIPSPLRNCPGCGSDLIVEAVQRPRPPSHGKVYVLRCVKNHIWEWSQGAVDLRKAT